MRAQPLERLGRAREQVGVGVDDERARRAARVVARERVDARLELARLLEARLGRVEVRRRAALHADLRSDRCQRHGESDLERRGSDGPS